MAGAFAFGVAATCVTGVVAAGADDVYCAGVLACDARLMIAMADPPHVYIETTSQPCADFAFRAAVRLAGLLAGAEMWSNSAMTTTLLALSDEFTYVSTTGRPVIHKRAVTQRNDAFH